MAPLLNSLFLVFKISPLPNYRVKYHGYIVSENEYNKLCQYSAIGLHTKYITEQLKCVIVLSYTVVGQKNNINDLK